MAIVSAGAYNSASSSSYGSTSCSDHFIVDATGGSSDTWTSLQVLGTSLPASTECQCKDYELHVKLLGLGITGKRCIGADGATCIVAGSACTGWTCAWDGLEGPVVYEKRYTAQWSGSSCSLSGSITPEQAGLNGEIVEIHASVMQGSTGNKLPVSVRVYD